MSTETTEHAPNCTWCDEAGRVKRSRREQAALVLVWMASIAVMFLTGIGAYVFIAWCRA